MAIEIISWPNLHEKMCRTRGLIAVPLNSQATSLPTELTIIIEYVSYGPVLNHFYLINVLFMPNVPYRGRILYADFSV